LIDTGVKNDDHLIKLAAIIQRIVTKPGAVNDAGGLQLTEEERAQLMNEIEQLNDEVDESEKKATKALEDHEADSSKS
jgi:hypothetical protein